MGGNPVPGRAGVVLVTGATGYVGGRLVPRLLDAGHRVRCLVRDIARLAGRPWRDSVEVVQGDVAREETLGTALEGVSVAYYMVHGMAGGASFVEDDVVAARTFARAAAAAGVGRIVYLGGLGDDSRDLSHHLRSRHETGEALRGTGVPVTEFRAGVVVGSGSVSFEMVRYLTERLPLLVCPRWVFTRTQPISIRDVLDYLVACLDVADSAGKVIEIGGADVIAYGDMMRIYAEERGLRRLLLAVPVLTPRLSSYWFHLVTPIPSAIARPLVEGLRNEIVARTEEAERLFPEIRPVGYREGVRRAIVRLERGQVETAWFDALSSSLYGPAPVTLRIVEGMIIERRVCDVEAPADVVFRTFARIGGDEGWPVVNWAWQLRGALDRLVGGVGMRRGRRHPQEIRVGDALDFWRVEVVEEGRLLRLRAEMKVPGRAWLEFHVEPSGPSRSVLSQAAFFAPKGLGGLVYWYALYPFHAIIFGRMVRTLGARAERSLPDGRG